MCIFCKRAKAAGVWALAILVAMLLVGCGSNDGANSDASSASVAAENGNNENDGVPSEEEAGSAIAAEDGAAASASTSSLLSLDDPDDYYLVNVYLSNFSEVFWRIADFKPAECDPDDLAHFAIFHCAYNSPHDWESSDKVTGEVFYNVPGFTGGSMDGFNVRVSVDRLQEICERYLGRTMDLSQYNATTGAGYKYWEGYLYFRVTNGRGCPEGISLADSLTDVGNGRYQVSFTVYRPACGAYDATDQSWYSLSRGEMARRLANGENPFTSTTGTAVLKATGENGEKRLLLESMSIYG